MSCKRRKSNIAGGNSVVGLVAYCRRTGNCVFPSDLIIYLPASRPVNPMM